MTVFELPHVILKQVEATPPAGNLPEPYPGYPNGALYNKNTPGRFGRVRHDTVSRTHTLPSGIQVTNEIQRLREYKLKDGEKRVFPESKCVVDITGTAWELWCKDMMGEHVYGNFNSDRYGFMDGPERGKLHAYPCGGNLLYEYGTHQQAGQRWSLIQTQLAHNEPGENFRQLVSYQTRPHWFVKQYNVFSTAKYDIGWTVDKGVSGGNGDVIFPLVTKTEAAIETNLVQWQRKPPFEAVIYGDSVVEEYMREWDPEKHPGEFIPDLRLTDLTKLNGIAVTVDELSYVGSNTFARVGVHWYLVEEMLIRGDYNDKGKAGNWLDYRKYWNEPTVHSPAAIGWIDEYWTLWDGYFE